MAINASDTTWGWYGQNHGVSVFFADKYHFIHENHELRFNADNIPHFQIRVSHTRQLGGPYSDCIPPSREASHCLGSILTLDSSPEFLEYFLAILIFEKDVKSRIEPRFK